MTSLLWLVGIKGAASSPWRGTLTSGISFPLPPQPPHLQYTKGKWRTIELQERFLDTYSLTGMQLEGFLSTCPVPSLQGQVPLPFSLAGQFLGPKSLGLGLLLPPTPLLVFKVIV